MHWNSSGTVFWNSYNPVSTRGIKQKKTTVPVFQQKSNSKRK